MKIKWEENTWPQIENYLQHKKTVIWPVGSTEQHGPTGLNGIDFQASRHLALEVGRRTETLVAPTLPFGMAVHHTSFPGTISLTPLTYVQVFSELLQNFVRHGFERVLVINGHGGNIAPITTAFCQAKTQTETIDLKLVNWWQMPEVVEYEQKHFGNENGFHATCGEVSLIQYCIPDAHKDITIPKTFDMTAAKGVWPCSPSQFRKHFPDGRMNSNPALASAEHGKQLFDIAVNAITQRLQAPTPL